MKMRSLGPLIQYGASQVKNPPPSAGDLRDLGLIPGSGRSPGESHGQRALAGYGPWGHKGSETSETTQHSTEQSRMTDAMLQGSEDGQHTWKSTQS